LITSAPALQQTSDRGAGDEMREFDHLTPSSGRCVACRGVGARVSTLLDIDHGRFTVAAPCECASHSSGLRTIPPEAGAPHLIFDLLRRFFLDGNCNERAEFGHENTLTRHPANADGVQ